MIFFRSMMYRQLFKYIRICLVSLITFDFVRIFLQNMTDFSDRQSWSPERRRRFLVNLIWAAAVVALLHLAPHTKMGQQLLNETYDYLVKKDFKNTLIDRGDREPVSDAIRLVTFDRSAYAYEKSPGGDFWTPRKTLGRTIVSALELGAKVVVADIEVDKPVPLEDENRDFLELLKQAADIARQNDAVIILPRMEQECRLLFPLKKDQSRETRPAEYVCRLHDLLNRQSDVIKQGTPGIFRSPLDSKVRHFRLYEKDDKGSTALSMSVLAAVYQWHGRKKGNAILKQTQAQLKDDSWSDILIHGPEGLEPIRILRQDAGSECIPARYKFRIVPENVMKTYTKKADPLFDMKRTSAELLDTESDSDIYCGKTVLIGSVHEELGDIHSTPLGDMPGLFLLANGMNIFLRGEQIHEISYKYKYSMEAVLTVLSALVFLYLNPTPAALTLTALLYVLHKLLSVHFFTNWGLFLDFWLMVIGIGIFENIVGFQEILKDWASREEEEEE